MKKRILISFFILIASFLFAMDSMALLGVADSSHYVNNFSNPASVYFYNQKAKFVFSTGINTKPQFSLNAEFIGERMALGIDVQSFIRNKTIADDKKTYDIQRDVGFDLDVSYGYKNLALGFGITGGSSMELLDVSQLFYQTVLGRYSRIEESPFVGISFGAMYKYSNLAVGFLADDILSYNSSEKQMTVSNALDHISTGVYWGMDKYGRRGRLNMWVFNTGLELENILNNSERSINAGGEVTLQFTNEYSVSCRAGAKVLTSDISNPQITAGLGGKLDIFDLDIFLNMTERPVKFNIKLSVLN